MSSTRCSCPNCHTLFTVAPKSIGKRIRCRKCEEVFVAEVEEPDDTEDDSEETSAPKKSSKTWLLVPAGIVGALLVVCAGVAGLSWRLLTKPGGVADRVQEAAKVEPQQPLLPQVEVDPAVTTVRFGPWRKAPAKDIFGNRGVWLFAEVTAGDKAVTDFDFQVEQFDKGGKKLDSGGIVFPKLKPNERGDAQIRLKQDVSKITICLRTQPQPLKTPEPLVQPQIPQPKQEKPIRVISLHGLHGEFRENAIAADKKYVGKWVVGAWSSTEPKVEKRRDGYWLTLVIGQGGNRVIYPVYGVECQLSDYGAEQYAKQQNEVLYMDIAGVVKGTRPYAPNIFGGKMLTLTDCCFLPKPVKRNNKSKH